MGAKLYVGNIAYGVCKEDLSKLFATAGTVVASRIILDRLTGRSRGFGFVEMSNENEAETAINQINGYLLLGRGLLVYLAHDDRELSRRAREAKQIQKQTNKLILDSESRIYSQPSKSKVSIV
jgi:RNA recognition motif-containing protein